MPRPKVRDVLRGIFRIEDCYRVTRADSCVDFEKSLNILLGLYTHMDEFRDNTMTRTWRAYLATLIITALNGLRISEALEAVKRFFETGDRKFIVKSRKKGAIRKVIIPGFIEREDLRPVYEKLIWDGVDHVKKILKNWVRENFGATVHGFRYSFIRYFTERGVDVRRLKKILGLRDKRTITKYYLRPYKPEQLLGETEGEGE